MRATSIQIHSTARRVIGTLALFTAVILSFSTSSSAQGFALSIEGPRTICVGETGVYRAVTTLGTGFSWTTTRGTIVSGQNSNSISVEWAGAGTDTITVYAVSTTGVPETRTITVGVFGIAKPIIEASGPTTICIGTDIELAAPEGFNSYLWSTGATNRIIRVSQPGTYSVTVFNGMGCSATSPPVVIKMLIPPEPVITALGPTTLCKGESVVLDAGAGYLAYQWSSGERTRFITATTSRLYQVTVTNNYGCKGVSPQLAVNFYDAPAKPVISRQGSVLTSSVAMDYQWYRNGTAVPGATSQSLQTTSTGMYTVRVFNNVGCSTLSDPFTFAYSGMTVTVPDMEVDLHRDITIPLVVTATNNLDKVTQFSYTATIRFDKSALYPKNVASRISGDDRIVTLTGTWVKGDSLVGQFTCTPMWSDITKAVVQIDSFVINTDELFVDTEDGTLTWLLCNQGGTRLFLNNYPMGLKQNHPNPFNASTSIEYSIIEEGRTVLSVYDLLGRRMATIVDAHIPPGTYRVPFDASMLSSGTYMYVLQTPTDRDVKFMELVK